MRIERYVVILFAGFLVGCATSDVSVGTGEAVSSVELASQRAAVMTVHGLSCPLCSHNLDGQLRQIEGVEDAVINLNTGSVTVTFSAGHAVTAAQLKAAVKEAGFTFRGIAVKGAAE